MTASPSALAALVTAARLVSAVTTGKEPRGDLPKSVREALARMDGALARIAAEERMGGATAQPATGMADVAAMSSSERDAAGNYI